jgi:hypothetical protein
VRSEVALQEIGIPQIVGVEKADEGFLVAAADRVAWRRSVTFVEADLREARVAEFGERGTTSQQPVEASTMTHSKSRTSAVPLSGSHRRYSHGNCST